MGEGPFQQFGSAIGAGPIGFTPPPSGMPMGMNIDATQQASATFTESMRSFKDSLAFSFQTLNLTLSSLNQSMVNMTTKIGQLGSTGANQFLNDPKNQYLSVANPGLYLGGVSQNFASFASQASMWDLMRGRAPAGINPYEFYTERNNERALRGSSTVVAGLGGLATEMGTNWFGMKMGAKLAGRLGLSGGVTGMLGSMALGMPFFTLGSAALGAAIDPMVDATIQHNNDVATMRRMSTRFGQGFNLQQAQRTVTGLENLALADTLNTTSFDARMGLKGFRELTMMGLQGNLFQGTSPEDLLKQVESASHIVKFMAGVMGNKDVQETIQLVKQVKDMGFNMFKDPTFAKQLSADAFAYGKLFGADPNTMMATAANMSAAAYGQYGNPAFVGIQSGMRNLAYVQELEKRSMLTPAELAAGGGAQAIASRTMNLNAGIQNSWLVGKPMLFAGMTANGRGFNQSQFQQSLKNGGYYGVWADAFSNMWSNGITGFASSVMNQNNVMADAAKQGVLDSNTEEYLRHELSQLPEWNRDDISIQDKIDLAAFYIQQQAQRFFGTDLDPASAKVLATKIVRPSLQKSLDKRKNMVLQRGVIDKLEARNSWFRPFERLGETWDKMGARLHAAWVSPAKSVADTLSNWFDVSNPQMRGDPYGRDLELGTRTGVTAYKNAMDIVNNSSKSFAADDMFSKSDMESAIKALRDPDGVSAFASKMVSPLYAALQYNQMIDQADVIKQALEGPKKSQNRLMAEMANLSNNLGSVTSNDFKTFNNRSQQKWDAAANFMNGGGNLVYDMSLGLGKNLYDAKDFIDINNALKRSGYNALEDVGDMFSPSSGLIGFLTGVYDEVGKNDVNYRDYADYADLAYQDVDFQVNPSPGNIRTLGARFLNWKDAEGVNKRWEEAHKNLNNKGLLSTDLYKSILGESRYNKYIGANGRSSISADDMLLNIIRGDQGTMQRLRNVAAANGVNADVYAGQMALELGNTSTMSPMLLAKASAGGQYDLVGDIGLQLTTKENIEGMSHILPGAQGINIDLKKSNKLLDDLGLSTTLITPFLANKEEQAALKEYFGLLMEKGTLTAEDQQKILKTAGTNKSGLLDAMASKFQTSASVKELLADAAVSPKVKEIIKSGQSGTIDGNTLTAGDAAYNVAVNALSGKYIQDTQSSASNIIESLGFKATDGASAYTTLTHLYDVAGKLNPNAQNLTEEQRQLIGFRRAMDKSSDDKIRDMVIKAYGKEEGLEKLKDYEGIDLAQDAAKRSEVGNLIMGKNALNLHLEEKKSTNEAVLNKDTAIDATVIDYGGKKAAQVVIVGQDLSNARANMDTNTINTNAGLAKTPQGTNPDESTYADRVLANAYE